MGVEVRPNITMVAKPGVSPNFKKSPVIGFIQPPAAFQTANSTGLLAECARLSFLSALRSHQMLHRAKHQLPDSIHSPIPQPL